MRLRSHLYIAILTMLIMLPIRANAGDWESRTWTIPELVQLLERLPSGREVLLRAREKDPHYLRHIFIGDSSITESTYSRSYSLLDGHEDISVEETIFLSRSLSRADAVVDLAHELTHFAWKQFMSPYRLDFASHEFIRMGIEGHGGELDAFEQECRVAWNLSAQFAAFPEHALCRNYHSAEGFAREKARLDYYALGANMSSVDTKLKTAFPELNNKRSIFTSSYAHLPYPIALAKEYEETRLTACANNARKYKLIAAQQEGRAPASTNLLQEAKRLHAYQESFCSPALP